MTRTRFAPSPYGYMNIGNLRSALYSYLIAMHDKGTFILRIEDTDQKKYSLESENFIYFLLNKFGLNYTEGPKVGGEFGPYIQSERLNIYKKYVNYLLENDYAYPCFCSENELEQDRLDAKIKNIHYMYDGKCRNLSKEDIKKNMELKKPYTIRQKINKEGTTSFHDEIYGDITIFNNTLEDQILLKSDGMPTFNLSNVVDDSLMNITHVTRGNEYLSSTPKYLQLYDAFNFDTPKFVHLPHIINSDGTNLNKNTNNSDVMTLLNEGFLPKAIINYIALLGWCPKNNKEFFTLEELIKEFDIKDINKSPSKFDFEKLKWFNLHYLKEKNDEEYINYILPYANIKCTNENETKLLKDICLLYKDHISYGKEIINYLNIYYKDYVNYDNESAIYLKKNSNSKDIVIKFITMVNTCNEWSEVNINNILNSIKNEYNDINYLMPIRIAVTGTTKGPDIHKILYLIGKDKITKRLG